MPKVVDAARVSVSNDAVWRSCAGCGALVALPPDVTRCPTCIPVDPTGLTIEQLSGWACIACGVTAALMVPAGAAPGHGQVFTCLACTPAQLAEAQR
jgi:hypothetical protein